MRIAVTALALLAGATAPVAAQKHSHRGGVDISIGKHGKHHDVSFGIHFGGKPVVHRPVLRPRRHVHGDACRRWVPPRCETITEKVWIPERCEQVWVPPVFNECVDSCGHRHRTIVREGYWKTITHPGRWECVTRTVQIPGRWETVCSHH
jgi:hypothetical protein